MPRRTLVRLVVVVAVSLALGAPGIAVAQATKTMRIGADVPRDVPASQGIYCLAEKVGTRTAGRVKIEYYPNSQLGTPEEQIAGTRGGSREGWFGAAAELYMALKEGVVDRLEIEVESMHAEHYDEIAKYLTLTSHEGSFASLVVNQGFWQTVAPDDRKIIKAAADECGRWVSATTDALDRKTAEVMQKELRSSRSGRASSGPR